MILFYYVFPNVEKRILCTLVTVNKSGQYYYLERKKKKDHCQLSLDDRSRRRPSSHQICEFKSTPRPRPFASRLRLRVDDGLWSVFLAEAPARLLRVLWSENKNICSLRPTARAHLLFVITCAQGPVYILSSVSTGVFVRKCVPFAPS